MWANANRWHLRVDEIDDEVVLQALQQIKEVARKQPGFVQYTCIRLDWETLLIVSLFETEDDAIRARAIVASIRDYYREHVASIDLEDGEVLMTFSKDDFAS